MSLHEIVLPETKPETEWVRGRALQKVSPTYDHASLQAELVIALRTWAGAGEHGRVGTEWRFRIAPPGAIVRPLVPDVAFLSYDVLPPAARAEAQVPLGAPTVAFEVLSPGNRRRDVDDKVATYLAAGTAAVVVVDPRKVTIAVHERDGVRVLHRGDTLTHHALPGFSLGVEELFERAMR
jgi:Uma2 family endonuclease